MATVSLGTMLKQMAGMVDTRDLSDWENRFLKSILNRTSDGARTSMLSGEVAEKVAEIYEKHFG